MSRFLAAIAMRKPREQLVSTEAPSAQHELQLFDWLLGFRGAREFVWLQYHDDVVDQRTYETILDERAMFQYPGVVEFWDEWAFVYYDPEFVELINSQYSD